MYEYEDAIEKISKMDSRLFCHFSDASFESLIDGDLGLYEKEWWTTLLEITDEERINLAEFIDEQVRFTIRSATLVSVPLEQEYDFVETNHQKDKGTENMPYIIPNKYILATIDVINHEILINENAESLVYENGR